MPFDKNPVTRRELLWSAAALAAKSRRGPVAFHYAAIFDDRAVRWYSRFDVLVLGGILAPTQTRRLRDAGAGRLLAYEWTSAFYAGDPVSAPLDWQQRVAKQGWALNANPVTGGAAEGGRGAIWYDFANPELRQARARHLAAELDRSGYQGLFFDTPGLEQLPPPIRDAFAKRHPGLDYNRSQGEFFAEVRRAIGPSRAIFLNQGYRQADLWLPYADFDLSESYCTTLDNKGGTRFRAWHDDRQPWEAVRTPMEQLIMPAARKFSKVRFVHLNYAAGNAATIEQAARFSFACAKLFNHEAYLVAPSAAPFEEVDCYFRDLGRPKEDHYRESAGRATREFEFGTVAVQGAQGFLLAT